MKFTIATTNGPQQVEGRKFIHYIGGYGFWFFYREDDYAVTHLDSGLVFAQRAGYLYMNNKAQAKVAIDQVVLKYGEEKIVSELCKATEKAVESKKLITGQCANG